MNERDSWCTAMPCAKPAGIALPHWPAVATRLQHRAGARQPQELEAEGQRVAAQARGDLVDDDLLDAARGLDVHRAVGDRGHVERHRRQHLGADAEVVGRRDHGLEEELLVAEVAHGLLHARSAARRPAAVPISPKPWRASSRTAATRCSIGRSPGPAAAWRAPCGTAAGAARVWRMSSVRWYISLQGRPVALDTCTATCTGSQNRRRPKRAAGGDDVRLHRGLRQAQVERDRLQRDDGRLHAGPDLAAAGRTSAMAHLHLQRAVRRGAGTRTRPRP